MERSTFWRAADRTGAGVAPTLSLLGVALALLGCGPTLLLPGGALDGTPTETPSDWGFVESISTIQLETRPQDPYSVNIWALGMDGALYVHAGANRSNWVEHIEVDPRVRVRIEGRLYDLAAVRVTRDDEFQRFAERYEKKYGNRPRNENIGEIYLYRLGAR